MARCMCGDRKFWTAAGVTAGIDLSLAVIEEDFGSGVALSFARELVVYMKRTGGQEQYSEVALSVARELVVGGQDGLF